MAHPLMPNPNAIRIIEDEEPLPRSWLASGAGPGSIERYRGVADTPKYNNPPLTRVGYDLRGNHTPDPYDQNGHDLPPNQGTIVMGRDNVPLLRHNRDFNMYNKNSLTHGNTVAPGFSAYADLGVMRQAGHNQINSDEPQVISDPRIHSTARGPVIIDKTSNVQLSRASREAVVHNYDQHNFSILKAKYHVGYKMAKMYVKYLLSDEVPHHRNIFSNPYTLKRMREFCAAYFETTSFHDAITDDQWREDYNWSINPTNPALWENEGMDWGDYAMKQIGNFYNDMKRMGSMLGITVWTTRGDGAFDDRITYHDSDSIEQLEHDLRNLNPTRLMASQNAWGERNNMEHGRVLSTHDTMRSANEARFRWSEEALLESRGVLNLNPLPYMFARQPMDPYRKVTINRPVQQQEILGEWKLRNQIEGHHLNRRSVKNSVVWLKPVGEDDGQVNDYASDNCARFIYEVDPAHTIFKQYHNIRSIDTNSIESYFHNVSSDYINGYRRLSSAMAQIQDGTLARFAFNRKIDAAVPSNEDINSWYDENVSWRREFKRPPMTEHLHAPRTHLLTEDRISEELLPETKLLRCLVRCYSLCARGPEYISDMAYRLTKVTNFIVAHAALGNEADMRTNVVEEHYRRNNFTVRKKTYSHVGREDIKDYVNIPKNIYYWIDLAKTMEVGEEGLSDEFGYVTEEAQDGAAIGKAINAFNITVGRILQDMAHTWMKEVRESIVGEPEVFFNPRYPITNKVTNLLKFAHTNPNKAGMFNHYGYQCICEQYIKNYTVLLWGESIGIYNLNPLDLLLM